MHGARVGRDDDLPRRRPARADTAGLHVQLLLAQLSRSSGSHGDSPAAPRTKRRNDGRRGPIYRAGQLQVAAEIAGKPVAFLRSAAPLLLTSSLSRDHGLARLPKDKRYLLVLVVHRVPLMVSIAQ